MVSIIAIALIGRGGLRRNRLERRMRADQTAGGEKSGIRYAANAHVPVVIRYILKQPLDRVMGIGAVGNGLVLRRDILENAFRHITPAHILVNENEPLFRE